MLANRVLLDAVEALGSQHQPALVLVGAQAIYLHAGNDGLPVQQMTIDADLSINPDLVADDPLIQVALDSAGFTREPPPGTRKTIQPGQYYRNVGGAWVELDLLVPEHHAQIIRPGSRRSSGVPPHHRNTMMRAAGLEAVLVDNTLQTIAGLSDDDSRSFEIRVAGPAALLVAKAHKLGERTIAGKRIKSKDAYDIYRLLRAIDLQAVSATFSELLHSPSASAATRTGIEHLATLFDTPSSAGSVLVASEELSVSTESTAAQAVSELVRRILAGVA